MIDRQIRFLILYCMALPIFYAQLEASQLSTTFGPILEEIQPTTPSAWMPIAYELQKYLPKCHPRTIIMAYMCEADRPENFAPESLLKLNDKTECQKKTTIFFHGKAQNPDAILHITISPYSNRLATTHANDTVRHWNCDTGKPLATLHDPEAYFDHSCPPASLYLAQGSQLGVASLSRRGRWKRSDNSWLPRICFSQLSIWNLKSKQIIRRYFTEKPIHSLATLPWGTGIAACTYESIYTFHPQIHRELYTLMSASTNDFIKMVPHQQGKFLITITERNDTLTIWEPGKENNYDSEDVDTGIENPLLLTVSSEDDLCAVANAKGETALISLHDNKYEPLSRFKSTQCSPHFTPVYMAFSGMTRQSRNLIILTLPEKDNDTLAMLYARWRQATCPTTDRLALATKDNNIEIWRRLNSHQPTP